MVRSSPRYVGWQFLLPQQGGPAAQALPRRAAPVHRRGGGGRGQSGSVSRADQFLQHVVDADVHSLTVHLAGTFTPTQEMHDDARRAGTLAASLAGRAQAAGRMRRDVVPADLDLVLEGCAAIRLPDPGRTSELRQRYLRLLLDGLAATPDSAPRPPLPGPPPGAELNWRWQQA